MKLKRYVEFLNESNVNVKSTWDVLLSIQNEHTKWMGPVIESSFNSDNSFTFMVYTDKEWYNITKHNNNFTIKDRYDKYIDDYEYLYETVQKYKRFLELNTTTNLHKHIASGLSGNLSDEKMLFSYVAKRNMIWFDFTDELMATLTDEHKTLLTSLKGVNKYNLFESVKSDYTDTIEKMKKIPGFSRAKIDVGTDFYTWDLKV